MHNLMEHTHIKNRPRNALYAHRNRLKGEDK